MVKAAKDGGFNAIIVQVRKRGDAYYTPNIEPKAQDIAADYDPLADVVKQAHAAGIQVHAWISVYEVALDSYPIAKKYICVAHPEWLTAKKDGATTLSQGRIYLDPGVPAVQDHILSLACNIAKEYAVDGIHLEGARYPGRDSGYNSLSLSLFQTETGKSEVPACDDPQWSEWRRSQITGLIRKMRARLADIRPDCLLSASVMTPSPALASGVCLQDWDGWMKEGIVDFVIPMLYVTSDATLLKAAELLQSRYNRYMYIGVGTYQLSKEAAQRQIADARSAGADGIALFSYHYLAADTENPNLITLADLRTSAFAAPAVAPVMPWRTKTEGEGGRD